MKSSVFIFSFVFLLINVISALGQSKIDSLKNELANASTDTARISILIDIAYEHESTDESIEFLKEAYRLSSNIPSIRHQSRAEIAYGSYLADLELDSGILLIDSGIKRYREHDMASYESNALYIKGQTYEYSNLWDSAVSSYKKAYEVASAGEIHPEWGDAAFALSVVNNLRGNNVKALEWTFEAKRAYELAGSDERLMCDILNQFGIIYDQQGLYSQALESYLQAMEFATNSQYIEGILQTDNNIGVIYDNMNLPQKALEYFTDALEKARINNMFYDEALLLNNISFMHQQLGDTVQAVSLLKKALAIDVSAYDECFTSYPLEALGSLYMFQGRLDSAKILLDKALALALACEEAAISTSIYKSLGQLYQRLGKWKTSKIYLERSLAIAERAELPTESKEALYELYTYHEKTNQQGMALKYLKTYSNYADSLYRLNSVEQASKLGREYEFRREAARLEKEQLEAEYQLSRELESKTLVNKIVLIISILLLGVSLVFIRGYTIIRKNNTRLAIINEEKNKLIGVVAHDLRNPLNMIKGLLPFLDEVKDDVRNPDYSQYLDMMNISADKMVSMIDRTLDLSAIENMKLNLKMERTNLNQLVLNSIKNFELIAGKKEIYIVNNIERQKSFDSMVDPNYLEQVIDNLISNAIKFSDRGKEIFIGLINFNGKNVIEVRDHGPGISKEDQENIYTAFRTTSTKPTGNESSTGLGLSIAQKFVKAMNGDIELKSEIGVGTSFIVSFEEV